MTCVVFLLACQVVHQRIAQEPEEMDEEENNVGEWENQEADKENENEGGREEKEEEEEEEEEEEDRPYFDNDFKRGPHFEDDEHKDGEAFQECLKVGDMGNHSRAQMREDQSMALADEDVFSTTPSGGISELSRQLRKIGREYPY